MNRGLAPALTLSVLVHGGAVAAIGIVGAAWLHRVPAAPPPLLYVDLVSPVVATSDRPGTTEAVEPRPRASRPRGRTAFPTRPPSSDVGAPAERPAVAAAVPRAEPDPPARVVPSPPPPPPAPMPPEVSREPSVAPSPNPAPPVAPMATAPPPSIAPAPLASSPAESSPHGTPSDAGPSAAQARAPSVAAGPPGSGSPTSPSAPSLAIAEPPRAGTGDSGEEIAGGAGRDAGGLSASAAGGALARRLPENAPDGSAPDGAIPPEYEPYVRALRQRIQDRLVYPWTAVRRGQQGVVEIELRVGLDGRLAAVEVVAGARAEPLRAAAVAAVRGSAPFPFPPGLAARPLVIRLPVEFRLR